MSSDKDLTIPAPPKSNKDKSLALNSGSLLAPSGQLILDLGVEIQRDVNGIEMGVLENGIPYLTQTGLAKISGTARSVIFDITQEWEKHYEDEILGKDRNSFLKEYLFRRSYFERRLYIETKKDGSVNYAYPDIVCMAILEYYAFESKSKNEVAIENYRKLAVYGLQRFIYEALNYTAANKWKYYNDRVSILQNRSPDGHFIVFSEVTGLIVDLINANLPINHKTIPDISVGCAWAAYWSDNGLDQKYGERIRCDHDYPPYYPQAESNPQTIWAYPDEALPEFRKWFKHEYLITRFPKYILTKSKILPGGKQEAEKIAALYRPKQIEE